MPVRLVALDEGPDITLDRTMVVVGRHPNCDARLDSLRVSRHHCCMTQESGEVMVQGPRQHQRHPDQRPAGRDRPVASRRRAFDRSYPIPARERPGARADDRRAGGPGGLRPARTTRATIPRSPRPPPAPAAAGRPDRARRGQSPGRGRPQVSRRPDWPTSAGSRSSCRCPRARGRTIRSPSIRPRPMLRSHARNVIPTRPPEPRGGARHRRSNGPSSSSAVSSTAMPGSRAPRSRGATAPSPWPTIG